MWVEPRFTPHPPGRIHPSPVPGTSCLATIDLSLPGDRSRSLLEFFNSLLAPAQKQQFWLQFRQLRQSKAHLLL
jgi:hypothetical protein